MLGSSNNLSLMYVPCSRVGFLRIGGLLGYDFLDLLLSSMIKYSLANMQCCPVPDKCDGRKNAIAT